VQESPGIQRSIAVSTYDLREKAAWVLDESGLQSELMAEPLYGSGRRLRVDSYDPAREKALK
jgi:hypothetical protein